MQTGNMVELIDNLVKRVERNFLIKNVQMQGLAQKAGMLGLNARDTLRDFQGGKNGWEAEPAIKSDFRSNAAGMLQEQISDMFAPTLLQYQHLEKAEDMLAESPTGKALLESSYQGHVLTRLDVQMQASGGYSPVDRILTVNPATMNFDQAGESFRASLTHVLGHEHFHAFQQRTRLTQSGGNSTYGKDLPGAAFTVNDPRDDILYNMHIEAAAHAVQIQVAYELKDKHPGVLSDLKQDKSLAPVIDAFENAVERNPAALKNGQALRAAHDEWFNPDNDRFHHYQGRAIGNWEAGLRATEKALGEMDPGHAAKAVTVMGARRITAVEMKTAGELPGGVNHMSLPGSAAPNDPKYNQAFLKAFEKDLAGIYERMDGMRQKFALTGPTPKGPSMAASASTPGVPKISAPKIGAGKLGL